MVQVLDIITTGYKPYPVYGMLFFQCEFCGSEPDSEILWRFNLRLE